MPVQVIWGREDRILPVAHSEGLPAAIKAHGSRPCRSSGPHGESRRGQRACGATASGSRAAGRPYIRVADRVRRRAPAPAGRITMIDFKSVLGTLLESGLAPSASQRIGHAASPQGGGLGSILSGLGGGQAGGASGGDLGGLLGGLLGNAQAGGGRHQGTGSGRQPDGGRRRRRARGCAARRPAAARRPRVRSAGQRWRCSVRSPCPPCRRGRAEPAPANRAWPRRRIDTGRQRSAGCVARRRSRTTPAPNSCCGR